MCFNVDTVEMIHSCLSRQLLSVPLQIYRSTLYSECFSRMQCSIIAILSLLPCRLAKWSISSAACEWCLYGPSVYPQTGNQWGIYPAHHTTFEHHTTSDSSSAYISTQVTHYNTGYGYGGSLAALAQLYPAPERGRGVTWSRKNGQKGPNSM